MAEFYDDDDLKGYRDYFRISETGSYKDINERQIYNIRKMYFPDEAYLLQEPDEEIIDSNIEKAREINRFLADRWYGAPKYNYFKNFYLEDGLEEQAFNDRFNTDKLRKFMWTKKDATFKLISAIKRRLSDFSNIIIIIYGSPNSGKSEIAQTLAKYIKYTQYRLHRNETETYIVFSDDELSDKLKHLNEGDVIIRDETPELSGLGTVNLKKNINNVLKAIRLNQNSFIFISPIEITSKIPAFHIETAGKYKKERMSRGILKNKDGYLGHIYVPLHNDEKFREAYLKRKEENIQSLIDSRGGVNVGTDVKQLKSDIEHLFEWCQKVGVLSKSEIAGEIDFYNDTVKDNKKIKGDGTYLPKVINKTWANIKKAKNKIIIDVEDDDEEVEEKIEEKINNDIPNVKEKDMPFYSYVNKVLKGVIAVIGKELAKGKSYEQINRANEDISEWTIIQTAKQLRTGGGKVERFGYLFEDFYALIKLGVDKEFLREIVPHNENRPDIEWEGKIYSLKYRIDEKHKTLTFSQKKDCRPEYLEALKNETTYYFVFMNPKWSQKILIKEIDPINDGDKIICKPNRIIVNKAEKDFEI